VSPRRPAYASMARASSASNVTFAWTVRQVSGIRGSVLRFRGWRHLGRFRDRRGSVERCWYIDDIRACVRAPFRRRRNGIADDRLGCYSAAAATAAAGAIRMRTPHMSFARPTMPTSSIICSPLSVPAGQLGDGSHHAKRDCVRRDITMTTPARVSCLNLSCPPPRLVPPPPLQLTDDLVLLASPVGGNAGRNTNRLDG
jgi:hypothetical protein